MGREFFKARSKRTEKEFPGCMSGVLHLFDFNQALASRKLLQDPRFCEGLDLEAPRNSLDIPGETMEFRSSSEANIQDIPFGIEFPKKEASKTKQHDAPRKSLKDLPTENDQKKRTPNVVARLMGLELMPDESMPVSSDQSRRNSVSGKSSLSIYTDRQQQHKEQKLDVPSKIQMVKTSLNAQKSKSFREHPQEKLLQEFKREFESRQVFQHRDCRSQYSELEEHDVRSASKRVHSIGHFLSTEKYVKPKPRDAGRGRQNQSRRFLDAMDFLKRNKELFLNVLQDSNSSQRNSTETKEKNPARSAESAKSPPNVSVFHGRSKSPLVDEVLPSCSRNFNKSKNYSSNNRSKIPNTPPPSRIVLLKPASESPRISKNGEKIPFKISKNEPKQSSNSNNNEIKLSRDSRNPREIAREIVKQVKEGSIGKFSEEINANQDFACSLASNFRRRSTHRVESIAGIEEESSSTAKKLSRHSGNLSPRLVNSSPRSLNSPRINKPMEDISNISSKEERSKSGSSSHSKSISPRFRVISQSKCKAEDRIKAERFVTVDGIKGQEDCKSLSPRILSRSSSVPTANRDLQASVSSSSISTSRKTTYFDNYLVYKTNDDSISLSKMGKNSTDNFETEVENAEAITNMLVARASATSQTVRETLARLDVTKISQGEKVENPEKVYNYCRFSSQGCRKFSSVSSYNKTKTLQQRSEKSSSSIDKTSNAARKWPCGEVGYGISDEKCEHPSPVSVIDGLFQEESPSPMDLKETSTGMQKLRTRLCLPELSGEDSCDSDQEGKATSLSNLIPKGKVQIQYFPHLQNDGFLSLRIDDIICPEKSKSYLLYVRNILVFAGFHSHNIVAFNRWYSPAHPVNPQIFYQLEEYYNNLKLSADDQTIKSSSDRKLIFELVDEILRKKVKPFLNIRPWIKPKNRNLCYMCTGEQLLEEVWSEICRFPQADCKILEDIEVLVKRDISNLEETPIAADDDVEKIGFEVEQNIFNSLIEEAVVELFFSL